MDKKSFFKKRDSRSSEESLAGQLEHAQGHSKSEPDLQPPPDEFKKIVREMEKRNITPRVEKELRPSRWQAAGKRLPKPALVLAVALIIMSISTVGVVAKRAYDYRARERQGGSDIVWNNDEYIIAGEDSLDEAYSEIEEHLNIETVILGYMPFDLKFSQVFIEDGQATMEFVYHDRKIYLLEGILDIPASYNNVSDRKYYKEVFNEYLNQSIVIEKNELPDGSTEYSGYMSIKGVYCYLSGIMEEAEFIRIVEGLSF